MIFTKGSLADVSPSDPRGAGLVRSLRRPRHWLTPAVVLPQVTACAGYSLLTLTMAWSTLGRLSSHLIGNSLDPWQTFWGFWWWRVAFGQHESPFHTSMLWWPNGVPLWFQTWDIPSTILAVLLWDICSPVLLYNLIVLASFPASGMAMYWLCCSLWGTRVPSFVAGLMYTFSTYHVAHAQAQLHLASMYWTPLFVLSAVGASRSKSASSAALAGIFLGVAGLASVYHFVYGVIVGAVLCIYHLRALVRDWHRTCLMALPFAVGISVTFGVVLFPMLQAFASEEYIGAHDSLRFSADLASFIVPNVVSAWSRALNSPARWSGNEWETAAYIGYGAVLFALLGGVKVRACRPYIVAATLGGIIGLGPVLHIDGVLYPALRMPAAILEDFVPAVRMSGLPTRFTWLTTFGMSVAAGAGLSWLMTNMKRGWLVAALAVPLVVLELWPRPLVMTNWPQPTILNGWAQDPDQWAVLDATAWGRQLWHQMSHRHPIVGGYITRIPKDQWEEVRTNSLVRSLLPAPLGDGSGPSSHDLERLRTEFGVRFIIVEAGRADTLRSLGLRRAFSGDGIDVFYLH